jgi:hypothetical protein
MERKQSEMGKFFSDIECYLEVKKVRGNIKWGQRKD